MDEQTIKRSGLQLSEAPVNAQCAPKARVFEYPHLDKVFIMESDLYGTPMPKDFCFLAFYGNHGLIGKAMKVETIKWASVEDIKTIVRNNSGG